MLTLLAVIGVLVVLFVAAVVATHDDEVLIDVLPDAADLDLPKTAIQAEDLTALRFSQAVRGYRMDEVDGVLERVSAELAARDRRLGALQAELVTAQRGRGSATPAPATPAPPAPAPPAPGLASADDVPAGSRPVSPLSGFSLPDISPTGWSADGPSVASPAGEGSRSASTPESGEWFFDPAGSVEAPEDAAPAVPPTATSPTTPDQSDPTAPDRTAQDPTAPPASR